MRPHSKWWRYHSGCQFAVAWMDDPPEEWAKFGQRSERKIEENVYNSCFVKATTTNVLSKYGDFIKKIPPHVRTFAHFFPKKTITSLYPSHWKKNFTAVRKFPPHPSIARPSRSGAPWLTAKQAYVFRKQMRGGSSTPILATTTGSSFASLQCGWRRCSASFFR